MGSGESGASFGRRERRRERRRKRGRGREKEGRLCGHKAIANENFKVGKRKSLSERRDQWSDIISVALNLAVRSNGTKVS